MIKDYFESIFRHWTREVVDTVLDRKARFDSILSMGQFIMKTYPTVLPEFIAMLGRMVQHYCIGLRSFYNDNGVLNDIFSAIDFLLFKEGVAVNSQGADLMSLKRRVGEDKVLSLSSDIVIPLPWRRDSMVGLLVGKRDFSSGVDRFVQGPNHVVELWLPLNIAFVKNGNHSIAAAILAGTGSINATVYDISKIYNYVGCNGVYYFRKDNNQVISPVRVVEFGAIFELGRWVAGSKTTG